jgi:hypothetical protein
MRSSISSSALRTSSDDSRIHRGADDGGDEGHHREDNGRGAWNFAIVTKEMKQGRASESIPDDTFPSLIEDSEKYLKKLIGRRDIEDALGRLDRLTQEEAGWRLRRS